MDTASLRSLARRRALRAAQIATLAFSLAGGGCGGTAVTDAGTDATVADLGHGGSDSGAPDLGGAVDMGGAVDLGHGDAGGGTDAGGGDAGGTDSGGADSGSDAGGTDSGAMMVDATVPDLGPIDPCADPTATCGPDDGKCGVGCDFSDPDCCRCIGGFAGPGGSCAIAGPFVPPQMA